MTSSLIPLIVTYNRLPFLKKTLKKWLELPVSRIVIVNNNSTDGTKNFLDNLSKKDSRVTAIHLKKNIGGAGGFKKGLMFIHKQIKDYEWIVLQDDDAYPIKESIEYFLFQKEKDEFTAYMAAVYNIYGKPCKMNIPGYNPFKNFKFLLKTILFGAKGFHISEKSFFQENTLKVDFASFVGFFIHKKLIQHVGYPKACFFLYADDLEYTLRITKKGFSIEFDPNIKFIHFNTTLVKEKKVYHPLWKAYYTYRNNIVIYRQLSHKFFPIVLFIKILDWLFKIRYYSDKWKYVKLIATAIKSGYNLKCKEQHEKIIQKFK